MHLISLHIANNIKPSDVSLWYFEILKKKLGANINLNKNKYGKPYLTSNYMFFNVSHSKNKACIVIDEKSDIGVDIEHIRKRTFKTDSIYYNFYPNTDEKLTLWTQMEAYYKMHGTGLSKGIDNNFIPTEINVLYDNNIRLYKYKNTFLYSIYLTNNFRISIASKHNDAIIGIHYHE